MHGNFDLTTLRYCNARQFQSDSVIVTDLPQLTTADISRPMLLEEKMAAALLVFRAEFYF